MGRKLYVGNLTYGVTDAMLEQMFEAHGTVESAQVIMDRDTGRSKGFGFVEMKTDQEAQAAIGGPQRQGDGRAESDGQRSPPQSRGWRPGRFRRRSRWLWWRGRRWRRWPPLLSPRLAAGRFLGREKAMLYGACSERARLQLVDQHLLLAYVADLELEVDRLRRQGQFIQQEVQGTLKRIHLLCTEPAAAGAQPPLDQVDRTAKQLGAVLRDLQEVPGYHPAHDQVVAIALRPLVEQVFRYQQRLVGAGGRASARPRYGARNLVSGPPPPHSG